MDINVKGFGILSAYDNKTLGVVPPVGEISSIARNFTPHNETFVKSDVDGGRFYLMYSKDTDRQEYALPQTAVDKILDIIQIVSQFTIDDDVAAQFSPTVTAMSLTDVTVGPSILGDSQYIPGYLIFTFDDNGNNIAVKLWFSDTLIRTEYDGFDVRVVSPLPNPSNLYGTYADVNVRLQGVTFSDMIERADVVKGESPSSKLKTLRLRWVDRADSNRVIDTEWLVHCYGPLAEQQSNLIAGVREYLLANTAYTLEQWIEHFPDLVSINIFTFIPRWDKPAVALSGVEDTIFNPTIGYSEIMPLVAKLNSSIPDVLLAPVVETTAVIYKSIGLVVVPAIENTEDAKLFTQRFPDYTIIGVNDSNINRLSVITKQAIQMLERLIRQAEIDDGTSVIPSDMTRGVFGDVGVVYGFIGTNQLQVVTKTSYLNAI